MKITSSHPEDYYEDRLYIKIETGDYKTSFSFGAGEPEDMNLARDLNQCLNIEDALVAAYKAGKNGEELEQIFEDNKD